MAPKHGSTLYTTKYSKYDIFFGDSHGSKSRVKAVRVGFPVEVMFGPHLEC